MLAAAPETNATRGVAARKPRAAARCARAATFRASEPVRLPCARSRAALPVAGHRPTRARGRARVDSADADCSELDRLPVDAAVDAVRPVRIRERDLSLQDRLGLRPVNGERPRIPARIR